MKFLTGFDKNEKTRPILENIVDLTKQLNMMSLTEGVETAEQVQILRDNYCLYAQGYYYDKPLPLDEFEKRLEIGQYPIN